MKLTKENVLPIIINALKEDIGNSDITSSSLFDIDINVMAEIIMKEEGVLAGIDVGRWVFNTIDEKIAFRPLYEDGDTIKKGKEGRIHKRFGQEYIDRRKNCFKFFRKTFRHSDHYFYVCERGYGYESKDI